MTKEEQFIAIRWAGTSDRRINVQNAMMEAFGWNIAHAIALRELCDMAIEEGKALVALEAAGISRGKAIEIEVAKRREDGDI